MTRVNESVFFSPPVKSSLSEFADDEIKVLRPCSFSFPGKILTPANDLLVPLAVETALTDLLGRSGIAGVLTTRALADRVPSSLGLAICDDPMRTHHKIHLALSLEAGRLWEDFPSEISSKAEVHPDAWVAPRNVRIGPGAVVMAGAMVNERCLIGEGTRVHHRAVIGADAYEIIMIDGHQQLRPQTGGVIIGRHCEVLAGSIVTRSAFCGATMIDDHVVIDCNVTISHDCRIRADVRIGGSSWLGGRVVVGERATLGPNCTIGNGLSVGSRAKVSLGAVVTRDVPADCHVSGNFAICHDRMIDHLRRIR